MFDLDRYYRVYASVDLDKIYQNMKNLRANVSGDTQMVAVVKADGYGHGAVPVALAVDELVEAYAVATIDEAMQLRSHNITKPIYLLGFIPDSRIEDAIENSIRFSVYQKGQAVKISEAALRLRKKAIIHIKLDTGMGRIGFAPSERSIKEVLELAKLDNLEVEGIFTHFARADEADKSSARKQLFLYEDFIKALEDGGLHIGIRHCSNSAGIIDMPEANMTEVRAGIALYGMYPSEEINKSLVALYPAMELKSHVIYVKEVEEGTPIGYGGSFVTKRRTRVATIPVGYGDGYPRSLSNKGWVLIKGKKAPIIGKVCMDQFMADVTDIEGAAEGDTVTLVGSDGGQSITVEEISAAAGTFNYEFVCGIGKRIPRVYINKKGEITGAKDYFNDMYEMKL